MEITIKEKMKTYKIVRSGWDGTWIVIPPAGLYEDRNGCPTKKQAILLLRERLSEIE